MNIGRNLILPVVILAILSLSGCALYNRLNAKDEDARPASNEFLKKRKIPVRPPKKPANFKRRAGLIKTDTLHGVAVANTSIRKKEDYIAHAMENILRFRLVAENSNTRRSRISWELVREADRYIDRYVLPLINDPECLDNPETGFEVAKLHLLSAFLYYDLESYIKSKMFCLRFIQRYKDNPYLLTRRAGEGGRDFVTLGQGMKKLKMKLETLPEN